MCFPNNLVPRVRVTGSTNLPGSKPALALRHLIRLIQLRNTMRMRMMTLILNLRTDTRMKTISSMMNNRKSSSSRRRGKLGCFGFYIKMWKWNNFDASNLTQCDRLLTLFDQLNIWISDSFPFQYRTQWSGFWAIARKLDIYFTSVQHTNAPSIWIPHTHTQSSVEL